MKYYKTNVVEFVTAQLLNMLAPFLVAAWLIKKIGLAEYGNLAFALAIASILSIIVDYGLSVSVVERLSKSTKHARSYSRLFSASVCIRLGISLVVAAIVIALSAFGLITGRADSPGFLCVVLINSFLITLQPAVYFQTLTDPRGLLTGTAVIKTIYVTAMVFSIHPGDSYLKAAGVTLATSFLGFSWLLIAYHGDGYSLERPRVRYLRALLVVSFSHLRNRVIGASYTQSGVVVVGLTAPPTQVALYALAEQVLRALQAINAAFLQSIISKYSRGKDASEFYKGLVRVQNISASVILLSLMIFLLPLSSYKGMSLVEYQNLLASALAVFGATCISSYLGYPLAVITKRYDHITFSINIGASVFCLACMFIYLQKFGSAQSIILALLVAEVFVLFVRYVMRLKILSS